MKDLRTDRDFYQDTVGFVGTSCKSNCFFVSLQDDFLKTDLNYENFHYPAGYSMGRC